MPRYRDPSTGKTIRSDEPLSDAELEEAFGGGSSAWQRAKDYLYRKGSEFVGAGQNLLGDVAGSATPESRSGWDVARDVATVGGPVAGMAGLGGPIAGPALTIIPPLLGAGAAAAGADPSTAADVETAADVLGGLGTAVGQGVSAIRGARGVARGLYGDVAAGAAQRGVRLAPYSQASQDLMAQARRVVGSVASSAAERRVARRLLQQLPNAPTYAEVDDAYQALRRMSPLRGAVNTAMQDMLGDEAAGTRRAAQNIVRQTTVRTGRNAPVMQQPLLPALVRGVVPGPLHHFAQFSPGQMLYGAEHAAPQLTRTGLSGAPAGIDVARSIHETEDVGQPTEDVTEPAPSEAATPPAGVPAAAAVPAGRYGRETAAVARVVGLPVELLMAVRHVENAGGDPTAVSRPVSSQAQTPAVGLMQVTPGTARTVLADASAKLGRAARLENPLDNLLIGGLLWRRYLDQSHGDVADAARLYFGGENSQYHGPLTEQYAQNIVRTFRGLTAPTRTAEAASSSAPPSQDDEAWQRHVDEMIAADRAAKGERVGG